MRTLHYTLIIAILSVALIGETIYLLYEGSQSRTSRTSFLDVSENARLACNYLASNYNVSVGLISETPSHQRYFLYSDNFLASLVLAKDCNEATIARQVSNTLANYPEYPNQFDVLNSSAWNFNASKDYDLSDSIWTTINNQSGTLSPNDYADIAFLQAYYYAEKQDNGKALSLFQAGTSMYVNDTGFVDRAFMNGQFQTYKLALCIFIARFLNQQIPLNAIVNLVRMQSSNGGFYTGYVSNFSNDGTFANTETTSLAIMALERLRQ